MATAITIEIKGIARMQERIKGNTLARKALRDSLRKAAQSTKAVATRRAGIISRGLARRTGSGVFRDLSGAKVVNRAAWANVAEKGRRPGAKMPPVGALRGGYPAAALVAKRGLPARPFMAPAARESKPAIEAALRDGARAVEAAWAGRA